MSVEAWKQTHALDEGLLLGQIGQQIHSADYVQACARLFAREAIEKVYMNGVKIAQGCGPEIDEAVEDLNAMNVADAMKDRLVDMNLVSEELVA